MCAFIGSETFRFLIVGVIQTDTEQITISLSLYPAHTFTNLYLVQCDKRVHFNRCIIMRFTISNGFDSNRFNSIMSMVLAVNEQFCKHNYAHTHINRNRRAFTLPLRYQITLIDVNGHSLKWEGGKNRTQFTFAQQNKLFKQN